MKFNSESFMTVGFQREIPDLIKLVLTKIIEDVASKDNEEIDYLQVFDLKTEYVGDQLYQRIEHTQEVPPFKQVFCFPYKSAVEKKIFCIDSDDYHTYLLAQEY